MDGLSRAFTERDLSNREAPFRSCYESESANRDRSFSPWARMRLLVNAWRGFTSGQHMASQFRMFPIDRIMEREGSRISPIAIEAVRSRGRACTHQSVNFRYGP